MICSNWTVTEAKPMRSDRRGQYANQNRLLALTLGEPGGCKADDNRVVAGEHQVDHHDLEKRCQGLGGD